MKNQFESTKELTIATNATVLTIAGSDPSGGAGLQADLKTFQQLGCYGMSVVTLLTVQNTQGVHAIEVMPVDFVRAQLEKVISDIPPRAIKTGALGNADVICNLAAELRNTPCPLVVDPVLVSKHGHSLGDEATVEAYRDELVPIANILTPNRFEAEALLQRRCKSLQDLANAAAALQAQGPDLVLLKAGEVDGEHHHMIATGGGEVVGLSLESLYTKNSHGAGCILSALLAGYLTLHLHGTLDSEILHAAVNFAVPVVHHGLEYAPNLGHGIGPVETRVITID